MVFVGPVPAASRACRRLSLQSLFLYTVGWILKSLAPTTQASYIVGVAASGELCVQCSSCVRDDAGPQRTRRHVCKTYCRAYWASISHHATRHVSSRVPSRALSATRLRPLLSFARGTPEVERLCGGRCQAATPCVARWRAMSGPCIRSYEHRVWCASLRLSKSRWLNPRRMTPEERTHQLMLHPGSPPPAGITSKHSTPPLAHLALIGTPSSQPSAKGRCLHLKTISFTSTMADGAAEANILASA